jgi:pSer/pThr/pTyr-binding forkhead associated (FHA) protein
MRARLVPLDNGPPIELVKDLTLVGRNDDCDIRLDHKSVSKLHCVLVRTDGLILVRDLGSTNGTRVNGQRVRRAALLPNDHLAIAAFRYKLKFGDEPDRPATEAGPALDNLPPANDAEENNEERDKPKNIEPVLRRNALPDVYPDVSPRG